MVAGRGRGRTCDVNAIGRGDTVSQLTDDQSAMPPPPPPGPPVPPATPPVSTDTDGNNVSTTGSRNGSSFGARAYGL